MFFRHETLNKFKQMCLFKGITSAIVFYFYLKTQALYVNIVFVVLTIHRPRNYN